MRRFLLCSLSVLALLALGTFAALQLSPWPGALLIRAVFDSGAQRAFSAQQPHLPADIAEQRDLQYAADSPHAFLDLFYPASSAQRKLPTIVWIHGGGWVSGSKALLGNYARILAGQGFSVAVVGYAIAPSATYPTPVRQVHAALGYLSRQASMLPVDADKLILAGDSAGAHIAAQVAASLSEPDYAQRIGVQASIARSQLAAVLLYCGPYDIREVNLDGGFGAFLRTVLWAYSGRKDFQQDVRFATASVLPEVSARFPPAFISAGNADPLLGQSQALASALSKQGVTVETLFFPPDLKPELGHEYQFDLDGKPGQQALARSVAFLRRHIGQPD